MAFNYRERSDETVKERANQSTGDYDDFVNGPLLKLGSGSSALRILPPTWDYKKWGDNWAIDVYIHRDIGPDNGTYLCLEKMKGEACPICDARGEIDDEEMVKKLKPQKQRLAYVIDRNAERDGPQIWRVPVSVEKEIQIRSFDKQSGRALPIDHPDRGYDISLRKDGEGLKTKYSGVDVDRNDSPLAEKQRRQDEWLDYITDKPLTDCLNYFDAEYIDKVFRAKGKSTRGSKEEKDDRPTRTRGRDTRDSGDEEVDRRGSEREERGQERSRDDDNPRRAPRETREDRGSHSRDDDRRERGRGRDEEDDPRASRGRDRSRDEDEDRGRERSRSRDDDPPARTRSARDEDLEKDEIPSEGRGRARDNDDRPSRAPTAETSRRRGEDVESADRGRRDEDPPARVRASRDKEAADKGDKDEDTSTGRARRSLDRLRGRQDNDD